MKAGDSAGAGNANWRGGRITTEHGYTKIQVGKGHPLADPNGYAYEHLIVWVSAGLPPPSRSKILHHRNEVKSDNRVENLTVITRAAHILEHHPPKISDEQVVALRNDRAGGASVIDLAAKYGLSKTAVHAIITGTRRSTVGGPTAPARKYRKRGSTAA